MRFSRYELIGGVRVWFVVALVIVRVFLGFVIRSNKDRKLFSFITLSFGFFHCWFRWLFSLYTIINYRRIGKALRVRTFDEGSSVGSVSKHLSPCLLGMSQEENSCEMISPVSELITVAVSLSYLGDNVMFSVNLSSPPEPPVETDVTLPTMISNRSAL